MLWLGVVTLLLLGLQRSTVLSLSCYYCSSKISWEDCKSKETSYSCQLDGQNACLKFHRKITLPNGKKVQQFVKSCYHTSACTRDGCYDTEEGKVTWCDFSCCHTNFCNQETKPTNRTRNDSTNSTKGSTTRPLGKTSWRSRSFPLDNADSFNRKRKQNNSYPNEAVQIIVPRPVYSRNNSKQNLGNSVYVTVAMVATSLLLDITR